jgi:signal recognition particle subunit SRP54
MPGVGAGRRAKAKQAGKKGKGKRMSGNPAKRAQQEQAAAARAANAPAANPFGLPADGDDETELDPADFNLPPEVAKFLQK